MSSEFNWIPLRSAISHIRELEMCRQSLALAKSIAIASDHFAEMNQSPYYTSTRAVEDYIAFLEDWNESVYDDMVGRYEQIRQDFPEVKDAGDKIRTTTKSGELFTLILNIDGRVEIFHDGKVYIIAWDYAIEKYITFTMV